MSIPTGRARTATALICSAIVGVGVTAAPAQASTANVLTMNGSTVSGLTYNGTQPQSFALVGQADGSWGIRSFYQGKDSVLTMNGSTVSGRTYNGTQPQSFRVVKQADGSFGIRSLYQGDKLALTMNGSTVSGQAYDGTQPQSFELVRQADGSWGIRAFYPDHTFPQEPQARDSAAATSKGRAVDVDVLANASGTGTTRPLDLTVTGASKPANGTTAIVDGRVRYTPAAGFTGCDTFTYTIRDIFGQRSTATARVAVADTNDAVAQPVSGTALTVSGVLVTGSAFQDGNAAQKFTLAPRGDGSTEIRNPATGLVMTTTVDGLTVGAAPSLGLATQRFSLTPQNDGSTGIRNTATGAAITVDRSSGAVTTTPYNGTQPQSLELIDLGDGTYALLTYYGSTQLPQAPIARTAAGATTQGGTTTIDALATAGGTGRTDSRGLTLTAVSTPGNGTATIADGKVRYTAAEGFTGCDTFTYTVRDDLGRTATGTVNIAVAALNTSA
ncbi:Ig-like domain-containing protein [Kitasatospora sp. NPDC101183]|uniref:Ig-like domain-containing protein n=1 Tax=Kitasatospora sp. NPDC101183 TaxID=3364100 RepID=UPI0038199E32